MTLIHKAAVACALIVLVGVALYRSEGPTTRGLQPAAASAGRAQGAHADLARPRVGSIRTEAPVVVAASAPVAPDPLHGSLEVSVTYSGSESSPMDPMGIELYADLGSQSAFTDRPRETDQAGTALWAELDPGSYLVYVAGFEPHRLRVEAGQQHRLTIDLGETTLVRGRVETVAGLPVPGAAILVSLHGLRGQGMRAGLAGDDGQFQLHVARADSRGLSAMAPGYAPANWTDLHLNRSQQMVRLVLGERGMALSGQVTDGSGRGIAGAGLTLLQEGSSNNGRSQSRPGLRVPCDAEGRFALQGLATTRIRIHTRASGYTYQELVLLPREVKRGPITIQLEESATISGRVAGPDGEPLAAVQLLVGTYASPSRSYAISDEQGFFRLSGAPKTAFDLRAFLRGYGSLVVPIEASVGPRPEVAITLVPRGAGVLRGRVIPKLNPATDAEWTLKAIAIGSKDGRDLLRFSAGKDGEFEFANWPKGTTYLSVQESAVSLTEVFRLGPLEPKEESLVLRIPRRLLQQARVYGRLGESSRVDEVRLGVRQEGTSSGQSISMNSEGAGFSVTLPARGGWFFEARDVEGALLWNQLVRLDGLTSLDLGVIDVSGTGRIVLRARSGPDRPLKQEVFLQAMTGATYSQRVMDSAGCTFEAPAGQYRLWSQSAATGFWSREVSLANGEDLELDQPELVAETVEVFIHLQAASALGELAQVRVYSSSGDLLYARWLRPKLSGKPEFSLWMAPASYRFEVWYGTAETPERVLLAPVSGGILEL